MRMPEPEASESDAHLRIRNLDDGAARACGGAVSAGATAMRRAPGRSAREVCALSDRAGERAFHLGPAVDDFRVGEAQHRVPECDERAVVRQIARALGGRRMEREAVELHDQSLTDQRVDVVAGERNLLSKGQPLGSHADDEDRLDARSRLPRKQGAHLARGRRAPADPVQLLDPQGVYARR